MIKHHLRETGREGAAAIVLALPRGGLPVGEQVAAALGAPLDVVVARKIGMPGHEEFGVGAVTPDGPPIFHRDVLDRAGLTDSDLAPRVDRERAEATRRLQRYRGDRPPLDVAGKTVIVVDDGLATGVTAAAALRELRRHGPDHLVFAAPVCSDNGAMLLRGEADAVLCAHVPERFWAVGQWYEDFGQLTDADVEAILANESKTVMRPDGPPRGVVLFAHGSGSSRHSPRNRMVAGHLAEAGNIAVLMDLLRPDEEDLRFDIELLAERLVAEIDRAVRTFEGLPIGLFGASTGAAAALVAAAARPSVVRAVVSRGGRPDLAGAALREVSAPVLLIVGGHDDVVIQLNEAAGEVLKAELVIVPGATHLFEEPGALETVAELARDWFDRHM